MEERYHELISKLDAFIRKYYKNQIIKGFLYTVSLVAALFIIIALMEYLGNFNTGVRTVLFFSFIAFCAFVLYKYLINPFIKLNHLGKTISYEKASEIIGSHFSEVKDKLLNALQLREFSQRQTGDLSLLHASIDQKINALSPIPFSSAINFSENRKYLKWVAPPLLLIALLALAAPNVLSESTTRLVKYNEHFEKKAPFTFNILNEELRVPQNEDFELKIELKGPVVPENVYIKVNDGKFKLQKESNTTFRYVFKNVQEDVAFILEGDEFVSAQHVLSALPQPLLVNFSVSLDYPAYTKLKDEKLSNTGNLVVPVGTRARWEFNTQNTDELIVHYSDSSYVLNMTAKEQFHFMDRLMKNGEYALSTKNEFLNSKDSIVYKINVIPDLYPTIDVDEKRDTLSLKKVYFSGEIGDDYGFKRLTFAYKFLSKTPAAEKDELNRIEIPFATANTQDQFFYFWDLNEINISAGDEIEYYFEVWDNDGVNGSKSTRSKVKTYKAPTRDELAEKQEEANDKIKDELEKGIKEAQELQREAEQLRKELLEKENLSWQEKKKIENLLQKQENLEKSINDIKELNKQNNLDKEEFSESSERILEKQRLLEDMFEKVMTDEMKELYRQLQEMMDEMDKDKLREQLEKLDLSNEDIEDELDRNLELFKQLEFEQKLEEVTEKLDELAKKQEELSKETEEENKTDEELQAEQEKLNEEFEKLQEEMDELQKMNEELEEKNNLEDTKSTEDEIKEDMKESLEQLEKSNNSKSSKSQKSAAQKMQEMSAGMQAAMAAGEQESQQEDLDALRDLLENIIQLSFDQEMVMNALVQITPNDPKYMDHAKFQRKLKDDAVIVKDSLLALSKRVIQLESIVNKEINAINQNMGVAIENLSDRKTPDATERQQYVMTSFNNLALLLDDALQQMQNAMANSMPGGGNCNKPGGSGSGKSSAKSMRQMQQALSKKLEQLEKGMGKGEKPGKSGAGRNGMSEDVARLAAEQGAIRRQIEQMANELNKDGSGAGNDLKKIAKEMEDQEKDLVNLEIKQEQLTRQQDIITRLLESEKAEREREMDNKRKSEEAGEYEKSSPTEYFEYKKKKEKELELLKTVPPDLKPYYKNKVNNYFYKFER